MHHNPCFNVFFRVLVESADFLGSLDDTILKVQLFLQSCVIKRTENEACFGAEKKFETKQHPNLQD